MFNKAAKYIVTLFLFPLIHIACDSSRCGGHGTCSGGKCTCERTYFGEFCQYKGTFTAIYYYFILCICFTDDCVDDSDCGGSAKGACIDIQAITRPMKQCFCNPGWQGPGCGTGKFYTY